MARPSIRQRVNNWCVERPWAAAILVWAIPCALAIPALVILADVRSNPSILSFGIPMALAGPVLAATTCYSALSRERRGRRQG